MIKIKLLIAFLILLITIAAVVKPSFVDTDKAYQINLAYSGSNVEYVGLSMEPCTDSEACWQIRKLVYSGSNVTDVNYANGSSAFNFVWDSRTTDYTYS